MKNDLLLALSALAAEKNLPREVVFDAVEAALTSAFRREGDNAPNINVKIDPVGGDIRAYRQMVVVEEVEEPNVEMTMSDAMKWKPDVRIGDVLDFEEQLPPNAGRIAAQTAKQVVLQRLREAERDAVYDEYIGKEGELLVGTIQRVEARQMIVELGRGTEAVLPFPEQVRNEHLRPGQRVKVLVLEVLKAVKGPQIVVSRGHRNLLRRLFEMEVPEIKAGTVEIKSIAREGGHRSKVAVHARNQNIDPIGACVGMRGSRIQNIVNELAGERIDVIKWDPDPANFVSNALSPAQVLECEVDEHEHLASVVVPDRMLSLAIGKEGQNARLAAKLTGWRITIQSQASKDRTEAGEPAEALAFEPYAPGETPDIDIISEAEEIAAAAEEEAVAVPAEATPAAASAEPAAEPAPAGTEEEEISFASIVDRMAVPKGEERESEDYGEDEDEEYEIPTTVVTESRPSAIRFGEDLIRREEPEDATKAKAAAKKQRRPSRFSEEEEDDMDDIEYSGRIH
ncbi:MAG: transcription termination/antitermination protein NusA [Dehalococcoidia bacterium]|nr:transcription termination/antitermination protein NusA [Dehalococcoidia bacterium]